MILRPALLLLLSLIFSGCVLTGLTRPSSLTAKQMKAYKDMGFDIYSCFKISGPPPGGGLTILTVPTGTKLKLAYSANCELRAETK